MLITLFMNIYELALFRPQKMGMMSLIKWSFLLSAALTFFHPHVSSQSCKKYIFITDFNSSYVGATNLTSACNFSSYPQNQSLPTAFPWIMNQCFMNLSKLGICSIGISDYTWNVTTPKEKYEIYLNDISGLTVRFILNASTLLPSVTYTNAGYPISAPLCEEIPNNQGQCAGRNSNYIVHVQQNQSIFCWRCTPPTPSPSSSSPGKRSISEAVQTMENLKLLVRSMNTSSLPITVGKATGLIQKQDKDTNVNIGYTQNQKMETVNDTLQETELLWSVKIPVEALNMARSAFNGTPFVGVVLFPDLDTSGVSVLKDEIFGISMGVNITNLTATIDIYFRLQEKNNSIMTCNSWDGTEYDEKKKPKWTTSGCVTNITGKTIKCSCTHLTFFAILMAPPDQTISSEDVTSLTYITSIGCGLSTFFLLAFQIQARHNNPDASVCGIVPSKHNLLVQPASNKHK
ncbi:adhesion G-protein coupled receptor G1-like [Colossoma macropomum]|uniref:adhesion G-protein coupled receptor G1-like n=1 Tax=Colossoma macropomum TaxID=42526 RepID=UPI0018652DB4|nr:adhesion G-protein coupled receptor G1-like [Colossoma macropomum]